jgi:CRP-like cAMP-binding protein
MRLQTSAADCWVGLCSRGDRLNFKKGQVLIYEGHVPFGVFVLKNGAVSFSSLQGNCPQSHVQEGSEGQIIGFEELLGATPYCCTCTAESDCEVIFISKTLVLPKAENIKQVTD